MRLISIISPVHNEEKNVGELCRRIKCAIESRLSNFSYEIVLIDDASTDTTWREIMAAHYTDLSVIGIRLGYGIGQHPAIAVGLRYAKGDFIVVMDGDLQDVPEAIPDLVQKSELGFDAVYARKMHEQQPLTKSFFSFIFNITMKYLLGHRQIVNSTFCLITRKVAEAIRSGLLLNRYFPIGVVTTANTVAFVDVSRPHRSYGKSKYLPSAQFSLALDAFAASGNRIFKLTALCQAIAIFFVFIGLAPGFHITSTISVLFTAIGVVGTIGTALLNHELRKRSTRETSYKIINKIGTTTI